MSKVTVKEFTIERRALLKWTAAALVAGKAVDFEEVFAAGECKAVEPAQASAEVAQKILMAKAMPANNEFLYWIDGPITDGLPDYPTKAGNDRFGQRGRLACVMNTTHTKAEYIESVTLVEVGQAAPLAQVFYGPGSGLTQTGKAPYTIFENLALDSSKTYRVIYVKNKGEGKELSVFQHTIVQPRQSRFDLRHLIKSGADGVEGGEGHLTKQQVDDLYPPFLMGELRQNNNYFATQDPMASTRTGLVQTPFSATFNDAAHTAVAYVKNIVPAGLNNSGDFEIQVHFMHGDGDASHYMRYFLVLDPVGRVLGGVRRSHGDGVSANVLVKRGFHTPASSAVDGKTLRYMHENKFYYDIFGTSAVDGQPIMALTPQDKVKFIDSINILDCPYVQILTDDRFHAIARCIMRLR